jgi:tetratricopeptide (TPR) repeat protein
MLISLRECPQCGPIETKSSGVFYVLAFSAIILSVIGTAVYLFFQYFGNIPLFISGKLRQLKVYEVSRSAAEIPVSRQPRPSLAFDDYLQLRKLLETRQFDALNEKIDGYQKAFAEDFGKDYLAYQSFEVFQIARTDYEELFFAWADHSPRHYAPHLARASFYYSPGWKSRGYRFAGETSTEQFEGMHKNFAKALKDIDVALSIKTDLMPAYVLLISIYKAGGERADKVDAINRALKLFPRSFFTWSNSLRTLEPRWGGSYAAMENFVKQAEPHFDANPLFSALYGYIYYDQAKIFDAQEKHQDAITLYTRALEYGDHPDFYFGRAEAYHFKLDDPAKALADVNRCIVLRPTGADDYRLRSRIKFKLGSLEDSLDDLRVAVRLKPGDQSSQTWMEWASNNLVNRGHRVYQQNPDQAVQWYNHALEFNAESSEAYYWRAVVNYRRNQFEKAQTDLDRAIEFNPRHFESYLLMDHVLLLQKNFDTIIAYWDRFLELEPTHARAHLERAGTYLHKGDHSKSLADLKRSCELGNAEACKHLEKKKQ